jgi:hypothetical protein
VTAECIASQQNYVHGQYQCADANAELNTPGDRTQEPTCSPNIECEYHQKHERKVEKIAVNILQDERERALTPVSLARLPDRARGRVGPKGLIVSASIVVAG